MALTQSNDTPRPYRDPLTAEHEALSETIQRLRGVVKHANDRHLLCEALRVIATRAMIHFRREEDSMAALSPEAFRHIADDHAAISNEFRKLLVAASDERMSAAAVLARLDALIERMEQHATEVDVPLFKLSPISH